MFYLLQVVPLPQISILPCSFRPIYVHLSNMRQAWCKTTKIPAKGRSESTEKRVNQGFISKKLKLGIAILAFLPCLNELSVTAVSYSLTKKSIGILSIMLTTRDIMITKTHSTMSSRYVVHSRIFTSILKCGVHLLLCFNLSLEVLLLSVCSKVTVAMCKK